MDLCGWWDASPDKYTPKWWCVWTFSPQINDLLPSMIISWEYHPASAIQSGVRVSVEEPGLWAIGIWLLFSFDLCICRFSKDLTAHEHLWHGIGQGFARWQHSGVWNETLMPGDWSDSSPTLCDDLGFIVLLIVGIQLCTLLLPSNLSHISHGATGIWWLEEVRGIWCRGHQRWGQGLHTCIFFLIWTIQNLQEGARCTHENHIFQNTLVPGTHG